MHGPALCKQLVPQTVKFTSVHCSSALSAWSFPLSGLGTLFPKCTQQASINYLLAAGAP